MDEGVAGLRPLFLRKEGKVTKTAFLCPGMGAQEVGMAADFILGNVEAADLFEEVKNASGIDIYRLCYEGPQAELSEPQNAIPCLVATSIIVARMLATKGIEPDCVAGFGCGEYAAHAIAGTLDIETIMQMAVRVGAMTALTSNRASGRMALFEGMDAAEAQKMCEKVRENGQALDIAGYVSDDVTLLSGAKEGISSACTTWKEAGEKCQTLLSAAACNSEMMEIVLNNGVRPAVGGTLFDIGRIPVYNCVDAEPFVARDVVRILSDAVMSPVQWQKILERMLDDGVKNFIVCGPKSFISDSVRDVAAARGTEVQVRSVSCAHDLDRLAV